MADVELELAERIRRGESVVLATVIRLDGQPPSHTGAKVLLGGGEIIAGTLGCAEFDAQARADAVPLLADATPQLRTYTHDLGTIEVYLEPHVPAPLLLVFGSTPVGRRLAEWGGPAGFRVLALEPGASVPALTGGEIYAVHTDHDDPGIVESLAAVLDAGPRFVGVMGSRRHTGHHLEQLQRRGFDTSGIQTPVGLDIGAITAEEIALSILAGVIAARHDRPGGPMSNVKRQA
jgi:xanthine dehydrogenase accessory factor